MAVLDTMERFRQEIIKRNFNTLEVNGFKKSPELALVAGMAMGYKLAIEDLEKKGKEGT